ncbi:MAG: TatD family hydrolase [Chloroflexi bacterium]|nr:TatD family hydrolase [Chloroflexota bacterium]
MLVDTHAHLDLPDFAADREAVIARAVEADVRCTVSVGLDVASSRAAIALAERYEGIVAAVGFHPHEAARLDDKALAQIKALAKQPGVVAIGEIGLDFYRMRSPREAQLEAFQRQLTLAAELGLPVVVHDREAHDDVIRILESWARSQAGRKNLGVLHCFSGDLAMAERAVDVGLYISIAGTVTFPNAQRLAEVAARVPEWALLLETDCPFLAPLPYRGKRNEPAYVRIAAARVAQLRSVDVDTVAGVTTENARRLFNPDLALLEPKS